MVRQNFFAHRAHRPSGAQDCELLWCSKAACAADSTLPPFVLRTTSVALLLGGFIGMGPWRARLKTNLGCSLVSSFPPRFQRGFAQSAPVHWHSTGNAPGLVLIRAIPTAVVGPSADRPIGLKIHNDFGGKAPHRRVELIPPRLPISSTPWGKRNRSGPDPSWPSLPVNDHLPLQNTLGIHPTAAPTAILLASNGSTPLSSPSKPGEWRWLGPLQSKGSVSQVLLHRPHCL